MPGKVAASLAAKGAAFAAAGTDLHHITLGPGAALEQTWLDAGLALPDLDALRHYRVNRTIEQLDSFGYDGILITDPMNMRYVTDTTNMQLWTMHNFTRFAYLSADRTLTVFDYNDCEFLSGHNALISEVRPASTPLYFVSGDQWRRKTEQFADTVAELVSADAGPNARIAVDQLPYHSYIALTERGLTIEHGQEVMELARSIKGPDELLAMRCAIHACEATMTDMANSLEPGMTEREIWAGLHAGNIARGGEWVETQILASGPRTVPWMQEASSRIVNPGEIVAYDTDLVGAYGMMCDISRTWIAGNTKPSGAQQGVFDLAMEQMERNAALLLPGTTFSELSHKAWTPPLDDYFHYSCLFHGVGQCDEYPYIPFVNDWEATGSGGELQPGMVLTTEAYVGARSGGEGVKLEEQYLITESGAEQLTSFPIDLLR